MADVCGPFTLDELDAFGGVDQLAFSLDNPIWQQADTCVLDSSAAISSQGIAVADGNAILAFQGNISGAASINGNGFRIRNYNAFITGNGSINANALRIRLFDGSIIGIGSISALGGVEYSGNGIAVVIATATAFASALRESAASVTGIASINITSDVIGENWADIAIDENTWQTLSSGSEVWVAINEENNEWLRKG